MKTILIKEGCPNPVNLGEKGENGVGAVLFDYSEWISDFGEGAISLLVKRKGDASAYPVVLTTADGIATWTISDTDTAVQGYGKMEYIFTIDSKVEKSTVFSFYVAHDIGPNGDPPEPIQEWMDELVELGGETLINAQRAEAAESGAEAAQTAAETAAENAESSATAAAQSAGAARDMAASALSSADRATASATAASGHATAAETAKDLAISAAEDAQHSETQAELSASAAAESAESASGSATTATTAAQNASASATQSANNLAEAIEAAEDAEAAERTATEAAQTATTAAQNAAQSASAASGSATAAATSETNAAQSATSAEASAQEAATEAAKLNNYLPVDTASGSIASFSDGADDVPVEALTISLEPIQSGSGDPSPTNIRPITGHTQAQVWRAGVNLLELSPTTQTKYGVTFTVNDDGSISLSGTATQTTNYILSGGEREFHNGTFVLSGCPSGGGTTTYYLRIDNATGGSMAADYGSGRSFTITDGKIYTVYINVKSGVNTNGLVFKPMIELGSTASAYEEYNAVNIEIPLGQTVYGGSLDVVGGKVVVDRAGFDFSTLAWHTTNPQNGVYWLYRSQIEALGIEWLGNDSVAVNGISSRYEAIPASASHDSGTMWEAVNGNYFGICDTNYANYTTDQWAQAMSGVQFVFKLATPITIDLTPEQLTTLLGQNNVWSDSGDVDVTYRADIQKYITKVISEALA